MIIKKLTPILFLILIGLSGFSQMPCLPAGNGFLAGDYPPGCTMCDPLYEGSTEGFLPDTMKYDFPCGLVENSQWISIVADSSGQIVASVDPTNCVLNQGVEFALYDENLNLISDCEKSIGGNAAIQVSATNLTPGDLFFLMIDGVNGDECDILVVQVGGEGLNYPREPVMITAVPDAGQYCIGAEVCFSIDRMPSAYEYIWEGPANLDSLNGGGLLDSFFCVKFNNVGGGILSVTPNFNCGPGVSSITPAIALPVLPTTLLLPVCIDELPFEFADQTFDNFGNYQFNILSSLGCDSFINLTLVEAIIEPQSIDTLICAGTCVQIQDTCFWESTSDIDLHCLFIDELTISFVDSFPAPVVECSFNNSNRNFSWDEVVGAENYLVSINGDSVSTQPWTNFNIFSLPVDSQVTIRVQPLADNNCIFKAAELTCPESSSVSIAPFSNQPIIYPNPTTGKVEIQTNSEIQQIEVFDFSGQKILISKWSEIDLSNFESGIYILKIKTQNGVFLKKVIRV